DRTTRVIAKANRLCSRTAPETWAAEVATLAELGRYDEARQLVQAIEAAAAAPEEAKRAAAAAKETIARLDRKFDDTDEAKAEMRRLYVEAGQMLSEIEKAEAAGTPAGKGDGALPRTAMAKFIAAWHAWRPNGQALIGAGLLAKKLGEAADAQRLFDRA